MEMNFDNIERIIKEKKVVLADLEKKERNIKNRVSKMEKDEEDICKDMVKLTTERADLTTEVTSLKVKVKSITSSAEEKYREATKSLESAGKQAMDVVESAEVVLKDEKRNKEANVRLKADRIKLVEDIQKHERNVQGNTIAEKDLVSRRVALIKKTEEASDIIKSLDKDRAEVVKLRNENRNLNLDLQTRLSKANAEASKSESIKNSLVTKEREADKLAKDLDARKGKIFEEDRALIKKKDAHQRNVDAHEKYVSMVKAKGIKLDKQLEEAGV